MSTRTVELYNKMRQARRQGRRWTVLDTYRSLPPSERKPFTDGLAAGLTRLAEREREYEIEQRLARKRTRGWFAALRAWWKGTP